MVNKQCSTQLMEQKNPKNEKWEQIDSGVAGMWARFFLLFKVPLMLLYVS